MRFYNREEELANLNATAERASQRAQFTVLIGRRRVGKTRLLFRFMENQKAAYFFVSRKSEALLCKEFSQIISEALNIPIFGEMNTFAALFEFVMYASQNQSFSLIIDEFQEFYAINPAVYSEMQNIWDKYKDKSQLNLLVCGSIYALMKKIFEDSKEPLFGRADERICIQPFKVDVLKEILQEADAAFQNKDLLAFYALTGGMPKYVEYFIERQATKRSQLIDAVFSSNSLLLDEGRHVLIDEFGKDYATYFSILSLIAASKTSRSAIESILQKETGGYLERLEQDFSIIKKVRPILAKEGSRTVKYDIEDNYLKFWFRFIYKYRSAVEIQNFDYLKTIVERDFDMYQGRLLEKYFKEKLMLENNYSEMGSYWERGNKNEIDIVAINAMTKQVLIAEVKVNPQKINIDQLKLKSQKLIAKLSGYQIEYRGLSVDDM